VPVNCRTTHARTHPARTLLSSCPNSSSLAFRGVTTSSSCVENGANEEGAAVVPRRTRHATRQRGTCTLRRQHHHAHSVGTRMHTRPVTPPSRRGSCRWPSPVPSRTPPPGSAPTSRACPAMAQACQSCEARADCQSRDAPGGSRRYSPQPLAARPSQACTPRVRRAPSLMARNAHMACQLARGVLPEAAG
jgi:hypothetical protein